MLPTKSEAIENYLGELFQEQIKFQGEMVPLLNFRTNMTIFPVIDAVYEAWNLDRKKRSGATFQYPNALDAYQWLCLESLNDGKDRAEAEHERTKKKG